jgi:hypothetical protein
MKVTADIYENIEFTTAHEDCHDCEAFLKNAYEVFARSGCVAMHTGTEACWGQVAYTGA